MQEQGDHRVREFGATRLTLRGDLVFTPQTGNDDPHYLVEDPLNSRFFRLGVAEYTLASMFDGRTTVREALSRLSSVLPNHHLSEPEVVSICRWLVEMDLAHTAESAGAGRLARAARTIESRRQMTSFNPLVFRMPLLRPDGIFQAIARWVGWAHGPWFLAVWLAAVTSGAYQVVAHGERFAEASRGTFAPGNWMWLALAWIGLKIAHETAHGVACRHYGGTVRETGILFVLLAPLAYVDVTSSWRFPSRWQRIHVAAAGMIIELLIAALAALLFAHTGPGWLNSLCVNVVVVAGVSTLLFNANPLMKFDGYYILSDVLGIPNLYVNGQLYVRTVARRLFFGLPDTLPDWPAWHGRVIRVYGLAAFLWRIVICASLSIAAVALLHGAGIVLAAAAIVLWIGLPTLALVKYLVFGKPGEQPQRLRFVLVAGLGSATAAALLLVVPWPGATQAPAVVEYAPYTVVRAGTAGFVCTIAVQAGGLVHSGQLLAELENPELEAELTQLRLSLRQTEVRCRLLELEGKLAECQAKLQERDKLAKQLAEKQLEVGQLIVRAPRSGRVATRKLKALRGTYLETGDEILTIGSEHAKELRISVAQDDLAAFTARIGEPVHVDLPGHRLLDVRLAKVIPRARLKPTHPALAAAHGGPLPVKTVSNDQAQQTGDEHELLQPRFTAVAPVAATDARRLPVGQVGRAFYRPCEESVGEHLYHTLARWIRRQLGAQQDAMRTS